MATDKVTEPWFPARSLALLISDGLSLTDDLTATRRVVLADALRDYANGICEEADVFSRMLDAGFHLTPAFDPEKWRQELTALRAAHSHPGSEA